MNITSNDETDETFTFCPSREFLQMYLTFVDPLLQVLPVSLELFDQMCSLRPACFEIQNGTMYAIYNIMNDERLSYADTQRFSSELLWRILQNHRLLSSFRDRALFPRALSREYVFNAE